MSPRTNLTNLQAWADARRKEGELDELAFYPGTDRDSSVDDAAWVVMYAIENLHNGYQPKE